MNKDNVFGALEPSIPETKIQPTSSRACADERAAILLAKDAESAWPSRSVRVLGGRSVETSVSCVTTSNGSTGKKKIAF